MTTYRTTEEITGRTDVNDVDAILLPTPDETEHLVEQGGPTRYTWDYEPRHEQLMALYEKAKRSQWNATADLDWSTDVDQDQMAHHLRTHNPEVLLARQFADADPSAPMNSSPGLR